MNSVFATAKGSQVSISPEALEIARATLSQAPNNFGDEVLTQSPLKTASGAAVPVDPETLEVIKRKFADYDDDACESPAKRQADDDEPDYSSLFRRAGSGKAIKISEGALSAAKRAMGGDENDGAEPSSSFTSPMLASTTPFPAAAAAVAAASSTTPLRSTPLQARRRPQQKFKSPFNSAFRSPIIAPTPPAAGGFSSPLARPATATAATPASVAASLSRLCLNSPASSSGVPAITPIAALTPNSRGFTIRVKVTERTGLNVNYGPHGEGRFCCWLSDASEQPSAADAASTPAPRLEAEAGGAAAERAAAVLQFGKVYDIHHSGRLSVRRPAPDNPRGIVLFFDEKTEVIEVPPSPPGASSSSTTTSRPRHRSSLLSLGDVRKEGEIDLVGIVSAVAVCCGSSPPKAGEGEGPSPSDGSPFVEVTLVDQRSSLVLALPQDYCKVELLPGDILLVYRASAKLINGTGVLRVGAVRGRTKLLLNPETEDGRVVALGRWVRGGHWEPAAGTANTKLRSIASIEEWLRRGEGEGSEFVTKAMVANVDAASQGATKEVCKTCGATVAKDTTLCNCAGNGIERRLQLDEERRRPVRGRRSEIVISAQRGKIMNDQTRSDLLGYKAMLEAEIEGWEKESEVARVKKRKEMDVERDIAMERSGLYRSLGLEDPTAVCQSVLKSLDDYCQMSAEEDVIGKVEREVKSEREEVERNSRLITNFRNVLNLETDEDLNASLEYWKAMAQAETANIENLNFLIRELESQL